MIELRDDGTVTIDFPDPTGKVTLRPPKYGAYRRLQNERQREVGNMTEKAALLPKLDPIPRDQSDDTPETIEKNQEERRRLGPIYQARILEMQDYSVDALANVWRMILLGSSGPDGDFAPLATAEDGKTIPEDRDDWPIELLVDVSDLIVNDDGTVTRADPPILDTVLRHWGKARWGSGRTVLQSVP